MAYRVVALIGVAVGAVVYGAAFFVNAPIEVCIDQATPGAAEAGSREATAASFSKTWVGIVGSRCELAFTSGVHVDDLVVEWGPSGLAIVGLVVAVVSLGIWFRLRGGRRRARVIGSVISGFREAARGNPSFRMSTEGSTCLALR